MYYYSIMILLQPLTRGSVTSVFPIITSSIVGNNLMDYGLIQFHRHWYLLSTEATCRCAHGAIGHWIKLGIAPLLIIHGSASRTTPQREWHCARQDSNWQPFTGLLSVWVRHGPPHYNSPKSHVFCMSDWMSADEAEGPWTWQGQLNWLAWTWQLQQWKLGSVYVEIFVGW